MNDSRQVRKQASYWLIELQTAPDLEAIWPQFETWLDQDPEHKRVFEHVENAWRDATDLMRAMSPAQLDTFLLGRRPRRVRWVVGLVLLLLGLAVVTFVR